MDVTAPRDRMALETAGVDATVATMVATVATMVKVVDWAVAVTALAGEVVSESEMAAQAEESLATELLRPRCAAAPHSLLS